MRPLNYFRLCLYVLLFIFSIVLLVLTAYHVAYTEGLSSGFYVPIVVELLSTSCIGIIFACWAVFAFASKKCPLNYACEMLFLGILWIMFLVGAVIITRRWPDLTWCVGSLSVCRLIDAIVAYAWINFVVVNFSFALSFVCSMGVDPKFMAPAYERVDPTWHFASQTARPAAPETRDVERPVMMPEPEPVPPPSDTGVLAPAPAPAPDS